MIKRNIIKIIIYTIIAITIFIAIGAFIWMLFVSLSGSTVATQKFPPDISEGITFNNYIAIFKDPANAGVARSLLNSSIASISAIFFVTIIGLIGSYGFYRFNFFGKNIIYLGILVGRMFPLVSLIVPLYLLFSQINLINKLPSLIIAHIVIFLPLMVWFMRGYMQSVPSELIDAASLDGCNEIKILFLVVVPVVYPGIVGISILLFIFSWGEFFFASALLYGNDVITLPVKLNTMLGSATTFLWPVVMAIGVIGSILPLVLGFIFQKQLISGLTKGIGK
ncbi:MAG: carbohydrate ABC transporter permease [Candidatus Humimicrobiaceae bacterium]